jgi:hypothetical protein
MFIAAGSGIDVSSQRQQAAKTPDISTRVKKTKCHFAMDYPAIWCRETMWGYLKK